ncbi:MAG TPA: serine hydrolase [Sphingomicrobium sp.]
MRLIAVFLGLLAFTLQPAQAASSPGLGGLEQQLKSVVSGASTDMGVAALDLTTGETVSINGETAFPMASTVKVAVAAAYLSQVDHGRRSLSDTIAGVSAQSLLERMMIHSDNRATDILIRDLGGPSAIQDWVRFQGVSNFRIDRTIARLLSDKRDLWDYRDSSTPMAMVDLLKRIDQGDVLKPRSRSYLMDVMARCQTGKNRMKALLPWGTRVEHKTGTLNGYTGDVGYITLPNGHRVALAMFARGGTDRPATIATVARTIYDGFTRMMSWPSLTPLTSYGGQ